MNMFATSVVPKYRSIQDNLRIDLSARKHNVPIYLIEEYLDGNKEQQIETIKKINRFNPSE